MRGRVVHAPMSLRGRSSAAFYTHRTRTLTMFVKKNVKMHSVACQYSVRQVLIASFWNFFYINYTAREKFN